MLKYFLFLIVSVSFLESVKTAAIFKDSLTDFIFVDPNYRNCGLKNFPLDNGVPYIYNMGFINGTTGHKMRFIKDEPILKMGYLRNFKVQNYLCFEQKNSMLKFDANNYPTINGKRIFMNMAISLNDNHSAINNRIKLVFDNWNHTLALPNLHPLNSNLLISVFDKNVVYFHPFYVENRKSLKVEHLGNQFTSLVNNQKFIGIELENINLYHISLTSSESAFRVEYERLVKTWDLLGSEWSGFRLQFDDILQ